MINTTRHQAYIEGIDMTAPINIVGCGSLGTVAATTLARMGFSNINLYDDDTVEEHNIANQYFEFADLGKRKVQALREKLLAINPDITGEDRARRFEDTDRVQGHIFVLPDNMAARRTVLNATEGQNTIVVDGRMGGLDGNVFLYRSGGRQEYERSLFDDAKAAPVDCTARTVIFTVGFVSSIAVSAYLTMLRNPQLNYTAYAAHTGAEVTTVLLAKE